MDVGETKPRPPASNLPPGPSDISDSDSSLREYIDAGELASGDTLYIPAPAHPGTWKLGRIIEYDNHHDVMIMMFYTAEEMQLTPPQLRKIRPNELFASNNYVKVPVTTKMSLSLVNVTYLQKRQQMPADGLFCRQFWHDKTFTIRQLVQRLCADVRVLPEPALKTGEQVSTSSDTCVITSDGMTEAMKGTFCPFNVDTCFGLTEETSCVRCLLSPI